MEIIIKDIYLRPTDDLRGLWLSNNCGKTKILFDNCASAYAKEHQIKEQKCIGERDVTKLVFIIWGTKKIRVVFKKDIISFLLTGKTAIQRFHRLQHLIAQAGFTSYDLS